MGPEYDFFGTYGRTARIMPALQEEALREKQYGTKFDIDRLRNRLIGDINMQGHKYHVPMDLRDQMIRRVNEILTPENLAKEMQAGDSRGHQ